MAMTKTLSISKSKFMRGLISLKELWAHYHQKELIPEPDESLQLIFDQGHEVGELAKDLFPGGIDLAEVQGFNATLEATKQALDLGKPIFEASFDAGRMYARADILSPNAQGSWDLYEVKSSGSVKEDYYYDVAFQKRCYEAAGLKIDRCFLMHVNTDYVYHYPLDVEQFFTIAELTDELAPYLLEVKNKLPRMLEVIDSSQMPEDIPTDIRACAITSQNIPANSIFELNRINRQRAQEWYLDGICTLDDIRNFDALTEKQRIQVKASLEGQEYKDVVSIHSFLNQLKYPLYFLDFETFGYLNAIPFIDNSRPYQQIPFQYSLHVQEEPGGKMKHYSFLHREIKTDPRLPFIESLSKHLGEEGDIIAWNIGFEKGRLSELARDYPMEKEYIDGILPRFVDLLAPFRSFHYYHPDQHGSASIKAVLPVLTSLKYEGMEIADGGTASFRYMEAIKGRLSEEERGKVFMALEKYCELDTLAMVEILAALRDLV